MKGWTASLALLALVSTGESRAAQVSTTASTTTAVYSVPEGPDDSDSDLPYLQCVPYARQVSGIQIFGDAWTWWDQAGDRYARGTRPKVGAVMSFRPYGNMRLGHVAAVSRVLDSRTVLLRHANWSLIGGRRGQIEDNVRAVDVSPGNDWSEVRVWFAPIGGLGTTHWPLNGFIYPEKPKPGARPIAPRTVVASAPARAAPAALVRLASAAPSRIGNDFLNGIRTEVPVRASVQTSAPATRQLAAAPAPRAPSAQPRATPAPSRKPAPRTETAQRGDDPIGRIISSRSR